MPKYHENRVYLKEEIIGEEIDIKLFERVKKRLATYHNVKIVEIDEQSMFSIIVIEDLDGVRLSITSEAIIEIDVLSAAETIEFNEFSDIKRKVGV